MIYTKYPRTFHLPWSPGRTTDDKVLTSIAHFEGKRVIASIKMDGENCTAYSDGHVHARSIDSAGGTDRAWVKTFLNQNVCFNLPSGWRICGENLWARHSIAYDELESFFLGFSLWTEENICLSWDETIEFFKDLNVKPVKVIHDGIFDEEVLRNLHKTLDPSKDEGYVVRLADSFAYEDFGKSVAKFVRANHVQTDKHWRHSEIKPNKMMEI